jgi:hypothetical protein
MTHDEILETILFREIQKDINEEYIKILQDPSYVANIAPLIYSDMTEEEIEEFKKSFREHYNRVINREIE